MNYRKYLKTNCEKCSETHDLVVHHTDFNHENNKSNNLQTLCNLCHNKLHVEARGFKASIPNIPEIYENGDFVELYFPKPLSKKLHLFLTVFLAYRSNNKIFLNHNNHIIGFSCHKSDFEDLRTRL